MPRLTTQTFRFYLIQRQFDKRVKREPRDARLTFLVDFSRASRG
jgi:hypothetical protein